MYKLVFLLTAFTLVICSMMHCVSLHHQELWIEEYIEASHQPFCDNMQENMISFGEANGLIDVPTTEIGTHLKHLLLINAEDSQE